LTEQLITKVRKRIDMLHSELYKTTNLVHKELESMSEHVNNFMLKLADFTPSLERLKVARVVLMPVFRSQTRLIKRNTRLRNKK